MAGNTHRTSCANAQNPGCRCSGCGGALHGWQGWTALATKPQRVRDQQRAALLRDVRTDEQTGQPRPNLVNRRTYLNLARLDIADHLSSDAPIGPHGTLTHDGERTGPAIGSADFTLLNVLADSIMADTWSGVSADIDDLVQNKPTARRVKKNLADHAWCTLLVALIQLIEKIDRAVDIVADTSRQLVRDALSRHVTSGISQRITDAVVDIIVDRTWTALTRLLEAHFPLLGADTLRVLRMLTVFACPSVEQHRQVYEHAVTPLLNDTHGFIAEEIKTQVVTLFTGWWHRHGPEPAR